jgi:hypothetical protein
LSEVKSPSTSFVKLATWSFKDVVPIVITDMVPKPKTLLGDWHGKVYMGELSKSPWVPKKIPHAPLDFYSGVTCGFNFRVSSHSPLASKVDVSLKVSLVCAYNSVMDFVFNGMLATWINSLVAFGSNNGDHVAPRCHWEFVENSFIMGWDER